MSFAGGGCLHGMSEILLLAAGEVVGVVRRGEVSSRELTEMLLERIDAVDPRVNALVELRREGALAEAAAADRAIADGVAGPLQGVPMTVKESFNVAGLRTTWGNPAFKDYVADWDATAVKRLRQAGAVILGKSNVPAMLGDFGQSANELYGVTNNPWDTTRTPGGSTGGGAAALAAGMTFLEYGSDLVGSIRIPASFCGVYGLRPSVETVPLRGFQPPGPPARPSEMAYMSAAGPLARSAGDLRTALSVTAGPTAPAANAYSWSLAAPRHGRLEDFRAGVVLDHPHASVSSDVAAVLSDSVDALARAGVSVVEGWPADLDPVADYESFGFHVQLFLALQAPGASSGKLSDFIEHENRRMAARAARSRYFEGIDVFLCPVNFTAAFAHDGSLFAERTIATPEGDRSYADQPFWTSHASLPGLPAVAAPVGIASGGLPVGMQIIGPLHEDDTAITFAEALGDVIGGFRAPPL
jgi:amidase